MKEVKLIEPVLVNEYADNYSNDLLIPNNIVVYTPKATDDTYGVIKLSQIYNEIEKHDKDPNAHAEKFQNVYNEINDIKYDVSELDSRLDIAESDLTSLNGRVTNAESDIDELQTAVNTISNNLTNKVDKEVQSNGHTGRINNFGDSITNTVGKGAKTSQLHIADDEASLVSIDGSTELIATGILVNASDAYIEKFSSSGTVKFPIATQEYVRTTNNLVNYYLKSETYTKQEVLDLIGSVSTLHFEIVEQLPLVGESNVIYLLPVSESAEGNIYDEYIYVNSAWEKIGSTSIDLSNYYTKEEVDELVGRPASETVIGGIRLWKDGENIWNISVQESSAFENIQVGNNLILQGSFATMTEDGTLILE